MEKEIKEQNRKWNKGLAIIIGVLIFFGIPMITGLILNIPWGSHTIGDESSWVSFFGSYLGGIVGTMGVIFTTWILIKENKKIMDQTLEENRKNTKVTLEENQKNVENSLRLEDGIIKKRELAIFKIQKSEDVASTLEEAAIYLTEFIQNCNKFANDYMILTQIMYREGPASYEATEQQAKVDIERKRLLESERLVVARLKQAAIKSTTIENGVRHDIYHIIDFFVKDIEDLKESLQEGTLKSAVKVSGDCEILMKKTSKHLDAIYIKLDGILFDQLGELTK